ncbi:MAG: hypothetical protein AUJ75_04030 [Candidatus Omnitrophica bacterium CG1_02_49_10]|nr:MAG: hypothetical protein AUJ75_04030 [Candidatus Omnitrophica bacterium CG1_02_49_10]
MKKSYLRIAVIVLVSILVLSFVKDAAIKMAVEGGVRVVTGLKLGISSFKVGVINTRVSIKDMRLYNPNGFKDKVMLDMPEIYVNYRLFDTLGGTVHIEEARINLKEFTVVKNEKGELNLDSLNAVQAEKGKKSSQAKAPKIQIDELELKIGKVIYRDYSRGGAPSVKEFDLNLNERYKNITNPSALVSLIVVKALMNTSIASLTNFDLGGLKGSVSDTLGSAEKVAAQAGEMLGSTAGKAQDAVKESTGKLMEATEGLKRIKLPFGGK